MEMQPIEPRSSPPRICSYEISLGLVLGFKRTVDWLSIGGFPPDFFSKRGPLVVCGFPSKILGRNQVLSGETRDDFKKKKPEDGWVGELPDTILRL